MSTYDVALGARLREARNTAGVTLDVIAERFGCTRAAVGHWEAGRRSLNAEQVVALAEVVHADPAWLLTGDRTPVAAKAHRIRSAALALAGVAEVLTELMADQP